MTLSWGSESCLDAETGSPGDCGDEAWGWVGYRRTTDRSHDEKFGLAWDSVSWATGFRQLSWAGDRRRQQSLRYVGRRQAGLRSASKDSP